MQAHRSISSGILCAHSHTPQHTHKERQRAVYTRTHTHRDTREIHTHTPKYAETHSTDTQTHRRQTGPHTGKAKGGRGHHGMQVQRASILRPSRLMCVPESGCCGAAACAAQGSQQATRVQRHRALDPGGLSSKCAEHKWPAGGPISRWARMSVSLFPGWSAGFCPRLVRPVQEMGGAGEMARQERLAGAGSRAAPTLLPRTCAWEHHDPPHCAVPPPLL
jgi:hypothetical protein